MRIDEFDKPVETELPFDVVEDVIVFMRSDPQFYRKSFFPAVSRVADMHREGKAIDKMKSLGGMVEQGLNSYCKKFKVADLPDEIFNNSDREAIIDRIFSEEMEEIQKGEYA